MLLRFFKIMSIIQRNVFTNHKMPNKSAKNHHLKAGQCWKWHLVDFGGGFPKLQLAGLVQGAARRKQLAQSCSPRRPLALLFVELHFCLFNSSCFSPTVLL